MDEEVCTQFAIVVSSASYHISRPERIDRKFNLEPEESSRAQFADGWLQFLRWADFRSTLPSIRASCSFISPQTNELNSIGAICRHTISRDIADVCVCVYICVCRESICCLGRKQDEPRIWNIETRSHKHEHNRKQASSDWSVATEANIIPRNSGCLIKRQLEWDWIQFNWVQFYPIQLDSTGIALNEMSQSWLSLCLLLFSQAFGRVWFGWVSFALHSVESLLAHVDITIIIIAKPGCKTR